MPPPANPEVVEPPIENPVVRPELTQLLNKRLSKGAKFQPPATPSPEQTGPTPEPTPSPPSAPTRTAEPEPSSPLPSFLRPQAPEPKATPEPTPSAEAPSEIPEAFVSDQTDPKKKEDLRRFRDEYKNRGNLITTLQNELKAIKERGQESPEHEATIAKLTEENKGLRSMAERVGLENHPQFQGVLNRRGQAIEYGKKMLSEFGADPKRLDTLVTAQGKDYYEAVSELTSDMPQAARDEFGLVLRDVRNMDKWITDARANTSKSMEALRKADLERGQQILTQQKQEWNKGFESLWDRMVNESKVEVFQKSSDPKDSDWNSQVDRLRENARKTIMENNDPGKLMAAVLLGHAADGFRQWAYTLRDELGKAQKVIAQYERGAPPIDREGAEPTGGPEIPRPTPGKPLKKLAIDYLHNQRSS